MVVFVVPLDTLVLDIENLDVENGVLIVPYVLTIILLCISEFTKISDINLSAFVYMVFHEDLSLVIRINTVFIPMTEERSP